MKIFYGYGGAAGMRSQARGLAEWVARCWENDTNQPAFVEGQAVQVSGILAHMPWIVSRHLLDDTVVAWKEDALEHPAGHVSGEGDGRPCRRTDQKSGAPSTTSHGGAPSATSHGGAPSTTSHGGAPSTTSHGGAQPDIAIFCGRRSAPYAALFHRSGVYTVFLGRPPRYYHSQLDLVIPSWHDGMQAQGITPNGNGHPPTGATRLVVARPEATRPVATRLGAARPVATRPEATRPVATRPEAARPVATRLVAVQPIVMPQLFSMHGLHVAAQPFASHDHAITLRKETTMLFVLIGGTSKHSTYSPPICDLVMNKLTLLIEQGWTLSVSASRRTPAALRQRLAALPPPHQYWEPSRAKSKKNPYPKAVTEAAAVVVTTDSVSMISESVAAEQPTYLIEIPTRSKRLDHFVKRVIAEQYAHPLRDGINMPPLATRAQNDTQTVAAWIARQLRAPDAS